MINVFIRLATASWFLLVSALALALLLFLFVLSQFTLRKKRKEVRVKAEKLKNTVETLEETVKKLEGSQKALLQSSKMREKLISLVIHDLRSPIRFLNMLATDLHENQDGLSKADIRERTYWIMKGTNDLHTFSEDFLLWVTSQKNNFSISRRLLPIRPLLQEMAEFFREQLKQKGNSLCFDAPAELEIYSDPHILITIVRNLIDNANKYTGNGKITVRAFEEGGSTFISVADTGRGMTGEQVDVFLQTDNLEGIRCGSQLGHTFILDLTRKMNGCVSVESVEGKGTLVLLKFEKFSNI